MHIQINMQIKSNTDNFEAPHVQIQQIQMLQNATYKIIR